MFSQKVQEELGFYVYCLVDPRDRKIFYVGKGVGNRVFAHAEDALEREDVHTDKLDTIREIIAAGHKVGHYIIRHKLTEEDALTVESVLIDFLTYQEFNTESLLTNIVAGHHQWDEGIKTVDEIKQLYDCEPLQLQKGHKLLMVNLNRSYIKKTADGMKVRSDLYEITRGHWRVSKVNADQVDYVLGVYRGVVRCVIKPTSKWKPSDKKSKDTRYYIEGITDDVRGNELYLNKNVKEFPFPSGGAIRYIRDCVESTVEKLPVANLKAFDTPKEHKTSEFTWEARLWEPIKAEMLKHVKVKMTIPKGRPYVIIQSVANKGKVACGISYSVRESEVYVWMETYQGEEMKEKILTAISKLPSDHLLKSAELGQGKKNKNKWAWSIKRQIDKTDSNLVKWCSDRILAVYIAMEDMAL